MSSSSAPKPDATHSDGSTKWSSTDGQFRRQVSSFRETIKAGGKHPPAKGRYRLIVAYACPWAHRALILKHLKQIPDEVLPVSVVDSLLGPEGWTFPPYGETHEELKGLGIPGTGYVPGHEKKRRIRDFYLAAEPEYSARSTVPIIWDEELQTIVSNESADIIRTLNDAFDEYVPAAQKGVTYYPEDLRKDIDSVNEWIYDKINNGVYKSGFATTQEAYESNVKPLFEALDKVEGILSKSNSGYLVGDRLTEADIRLFTTIIRFDPVYVGHFKCNINTIRHGYPHLNKWVRELYWNEPAFKETTVFDSIKAHYYQSHPNVNPTRVVPAGPLPPIEPL